MKIILMLSRAYLLMRNCIREVSAFEQANPDKPVIRLGIGDVTLPLSKSVIESLHSAVDEMGNAETFKGYGPEQGYDFLRNAIHGLLQEKLVLKLNR